jgi:invasion protein IalB
MKSSFKFTICLAAFVLGAAGLSYAQQTPKSKAPAQTPPAPASQAGSAPPASPGWVGRCSSASRDAPLECAIEQNAVLTKTGQLIVLVNIRVPGDTRTPTGVIQLPLGLNLQVGAKVQVDDGKTTDLAIQTCDSRGCYINTPISAELLAALKSGKQLKISFQDLAKETITIPMPLADFAAAYDKIK